MTIRENLAQNLRKLCEQEESIAHVCRQTDLNRQQFSRYLKGQSIPNRTTLKKICEYFNIDESDLLINSGSTSLNQLAKLQNSSILPEFQTTLQNISADPPLSLHPGVYFTYFVLLDENPIKLTRSVVVLRKDEEMLTFRRLTNFAESSKSPWHYIRGDHTGLVIERSHWFYFVGFSYQGTGEPSMIAVQWLPISHKILSGTALVGDDSGPRAFPIFMEDVSALLSVRQALKKSNVVPLSSGDISPQLRNIITRKI